MVLQIKRSSELSGILFGGSEDDKIGAPNLRRDSKEWEGRARKLGPSDTFASCIVLEGSLVSIKDVQAPKTSGRWTAPIPEFQAFIHCVLLLVVYVIPI